MSLRSTTWRLISLPLLMVFCTSELLGATALSGLGTVVRPPSPYDPAQPFMVYVPGDTLRRGNVIEQEGSGGLFVRTPQQRLLGVVDEMGVFPHLPHVPVDPRLGITAVQDFSVRWAKPFRSGLFGGGFYLGFKKTLMQTLHENHIYIVTALHALGALAQANPDRFFRGFGQFDAQKIFQATAQMPDDKIPDPLIPGKSLSPQELLSQVMTRVRKSHDTLASVLDMPPASIDPDLMLNWLDSVNLGPQYGSEGTRKPLIADQQTVQKQIRQYCAVTYVPWVLKANVREGLADDPRAHEGVLSKKIMDGGLRDSSKYLALPSHVESGGGGTLAQLRLEDLKLDPHRDPRTEKLKYRWAGHAYALPLGSGTRLFRESGIGSLVKPQATLSDKRTLEDAFAATEFTQLSYEFLKAHLQKLSYLQATFGHLRTKKISPDDIWALVTHYTLENLLDGGRHGLRDLNAVHRSLFHAAERAQFTPVERLQGPDQIKQIVAQSEGRGSDGNPLTPEEAHKYVRLQIEQSSYTLCQAVAYQNFYDNYLLARDNPERTIPPVSQQRSVWESPELASFFKFPTEAHRWKTETDQTAALFSPLSLFPSLKGWGYFYDILIRFGEMPRPGEGPVPYVRGIPMDNHTQPFIPGLIHSPTKMWWDVLLNLMYMPLDLTLLPEFQAEGAPAQAQWLIQDAGTQSFAAVLNVSQNTSVYLNQRVRESTLDQLKEVSLYLFRNRVGFTPQEQYLFLMSYFQEYLLPLAYLFQFFTPNVFSDPKLSELMGFEVAEGQISAELVQMLQQGPSNDFVMRNNLPRGDKPQFYIQPKDTSDESGKKRLRISFLDPILAAFNKPLPVEDATSYGKLEHAIAKLNHYIDQRVRWCWATPRHTLPLRDNVDQIIFEEGADEVGNKRQRPAVQIRAREDSASPYLYPKETEGDQINEVFPIPGIVGPDASEQERELWLILLCSFPTFIRYYFEGYIDLAQRYQQAMQIFRHIELFQRKRIMDTAHLTYLEGLPERAVFQLDYAMADAQEMADAQNRKRDQLNRTVYAQEVSRYLREKQEYITTFDNVQSMLDGAFKADYTTSDYVHALEQVYLGISPISGAGGEGKVKTIGAAVYDAVGKAYNSGVLKFETLQERVDQEQEVLKKFKDESKSEVKEARKLTHTWWREAHDKVINPIVDENVRASEKLTVHDYECRDESNLTELHLVYQNKLACSLQRQAIYKVMLQNTLLKYRKAMNSFFDIDGVSQDDPDPFVRILRWAAWKFEQMLTAENLGNLGTQLKEMTESKQEQTLPMELLGASQNPQMLAGMESAAPAQAPVPEDLSWEDAIGEVERIQVDVVGGFLREMVEVIKEFRPEQTAGQDAVAVFKDVLIRYRQAVQQAFGVESAQNIFQGVSSRFYERDINHMRATYWFFGPNVLFENPNYVPKLEHLSQIKAYFDDFYPMIPLSGDQSIPGLALNEADDQTGMSFARGKTSDPDKKDRRAAIELLRHFDLQLLKYGMSNLVNAKLLLGDEASLQPVSKDLYDELGGVGAREVDHEQFMGNTDVYGEVAPFEMLLFIFNRSSPAWKAWRSFVSNVSILNFVAPDLGLSTPIGLRYSADAYSNEDWLGMNALVGRVGKALGWSKRDSNWHLLMHRGFCRIGARLQGGSLVQDLIQSKTFEWEAWPHLKSVVWNVFQIFRDPQVPQTRVDRSVEESTTLRTQDVVNFREEFESWYCDVYSIDRGHPPTGPFTLAERNVVTVADQRIAAAKQELQEPDFRQGAQELKQVQGSKLFEGAVLWTFLEMLNAYVIEPYTKSGFALQELFADLDLTLRSHLGYFVNENDQSTLPYRVNVPGLSYAAKHFVTGETVEVGARLKNAINNFVELKWFDTHTLRNNFDSFTNDGVLMDFLSRVKDEHGALDERDKYPDLQRRLLEVFHINYVKASPQEIDGVVDVPGYIDGTDGVQKFLHGGKDEIVKFLEEDLTAPLAGGQDRGGGELAWNMLTWLPKKAFGGLLPDYVRYITGHMPGEQSPDRCITEMERVKETLLPEQKLSKSAFDALSEEARATYLANVEMVNALDQYAAYLEIRYKAPDVNQNVEQPGFCFLKRLAFNTAYQLLLGKRDMEKESQQAREAHEAESCAQLVETYSDNLKWALGTKTLEKFKTLVSSSRSLNQKYCHNILYAFKAADVFRRITGYGSDLPKENALQRQEPPAAAPPGSFPEGMAAAASAQQPLPGQEAPPIRQPFGALNLLVVYKDGLNELNQWQNMMVQNVALQYPQLDAQVGRDEALGQIIWGQNPGRPFIKRAYMEIVKKHAPHLLEPMQKLVKQFHRHSGPLCEFFNAQLLSSGGGEGSTHPREEFLNHPQRQAYLTAKLAGNTYVLGSNLCLSAEGISNFALTRWAHQSEAQAEARLEEARTKAATQVGDRYHSMMDILLEAFPWMADVTVSGGREPVNFHTWLANFGGEGPATALYQWTQAHSGEPTTKSVAKFVEDETPLGYTGILQASVKQTLHVIAQQYHASHNAMVRSSEFDIERLKGLEGKAREAEEAKFEAMDQATLFALLAQRFSIPKLYDQVRAEVGARYDKFYYYFVPVQVWNQFKRFEEYQSVVGTFTGAIFVLQMMMSMTPLTMFFRNVMGSAIRTGLRVGGTMGAVMGFLMVSSAALFVSYTGGAFLAYRVFNIFGANWRPIKLAFFGATLVSSLFIGLSKIQFMNWMFRAITPSLHALLQIGWYFLLMDIVMYFGDKVTWDYASREYGYYQALYETYMTRQQFQMSKNSSVAKMFEREAELFAQLPGNHELAQQQRAQQEKDDPLSTPAPIEHAPIFSEYQYVKHLHRTSQMQLSYMWFGILMAGAMDYAQLRTFMRFKGINVVPYRGLSHWIPRELRAEMTGVEGKLDGKVEEFLGHFGRTEERGNWGTLRTKLQTYVENRYATSPFPITSSGRRGPEAARLSRAMTDLLRSMGWATARGGGWQDAAINAKFALRLVLEDPDVVADLRQGLGEHADRLGGLLEQARHEIDRMDSYLLSETVMDPVRLGTEAQPALSQVLVLLREPEQAVPFLQKLSNIIVNVMETGRVTPSHFLDQLTFHHAKWEIMVTHAEAFRTFEKQRGTLAKRQSKPDTIDEATYEKQLRAMVLEQVMLGTDWKTVDNEMEFQIIRYVFWNNSIMQFLRVHGKFWAGRTLGGAWSATKALLPWRLPGSLMMGKKQLERVAAYLQSGARNANRIHYGESLEEAQERMMAIMGVPMVRAMAQQRAFDLDGYIMELRDMAPFFIDSMERQGANLNLPPFMQKTVTDVVHDYRVLQASAGVTEDVEPGEVPGKLGVLQRAGEDDVEAMRGFFDLWSIGLLRRPEREGPEVQIVRELSTPEIIRQMNPYELDDFLGSVKDLAVTHGLSEGEFKQVLAKAVGVAPAQLPATIEAVTVSSVLASRGKRRSHLYTQKLLGELAAAIIRKKGHAPLERYEALVKFKLDLIGKIDQLQSGQLTGGGHPIRLVTLEDLDWLADHLQRSELQNLAEGDKQYGTTHSMLGGQSSDGTVYRLYTAHADEHDRFFADIHAKEWGWKRSFGAVGPYVFLKTDQTGAIQRLQDPAYWSRYQPKMLNLRTLMDTSPRPLTPEEAQDAAWEGPPD